MRGLPDRRPYVLLMPALSLLVLLLVVPIAIMVVFTFYTFVTAGVEKPVLTLANWQEFLSDPYYHAFLWKTVRVATITALVCAVMGYPAAYEPVISAGAGGWRNQWNQYPDKTWWLDDVPETGVDQVFIVVNPDKLA